MKKLCVVTATRAEYGVLRPLIRKILEEPYFELCLVVTGTHLSEEFGYTINEIEEDGFPIAEKVEILDKDHTKVGICRTMGAANEKFGELYERQKPDMLIVVGDRYELLPICSSAMIFGIPITHISGGELTEGNIDDVVRHCITKMSYLHFPGCERYRQRIIQLGEEPERVFNYGDIGVENLRNMVYLSKTELEESLGISLDKPYASVTFHPVTLEKNTAEYQTKELIRALKKYSQFNFIVTMSNADFEGEIINGLFRESEKTSDHIFCFSSLGIQRYLSLVKYAQFVIGNSSSGIIEVPYFGIPTINIGDRQLGRLRAESVIDCDAVEKNICESIELAMSEDFREMAKKAKSPYGDGNTSQRIVETIKKYFQEEKIELKKKFFDIEGEGIDDVF